MFLKIAVVVPNVSNFSLTGGSILLKTSNNGLQTGALTGAAFTYWDGSTLSSSNAFTSIVVPQGTYYIEAFGTITDDSPTSYQWLVAAQAFPYVTLSLCPCPSAFITPVQTLTISKLYNQSASTITTDTVTQDGSKTTVPFVLAGAPYYVVILDSYGDFSTNSSISSSWKASIATSLTLDSLTNTYTPSTAVAASSAGNWFSVNGFGLFHALALVVVPAGKYYVFSQLKTLQAYGDTTNTYLSDITVKVNAFPIYNCFPVSKQFQDTIAVDSASKTTVVTTTTGGSQWYPLVLSNACKFIVAIDLLASNLEFITVSTVTLTDIVSQVILSRTADPSGTITSMQAATGDSEAGPPGSCVAIIQETVPAGTYYVYGSVTVTTRELNRNTVQYTLRVLATPVI